jgi:hypothetical protein
MASCGLNQTPPGQKNDNQCRFSGCANHARGVVASYDFGSTLRLTMLYMKQIPMLGLLGLLLALPACKPQPPVETPPPVSASPQDALVAASRQLGEAANYTWSSSSQEAGGGASPLASLGTIEGRAEKGGIIYLHFSMGDILIEVFRDGPKAAAQVQTGGWHPLDEIAKLGGTPAAIVRSIRVYRAPADEFARLAQNVTDLKQVDGAVAGGLKEDVVKELLLFGTRSRQGKEPEATGAKGSVRFWTTNGRLTKYEVRIQGKVTEGDRESNINRVTTVQIKNTGSTKLEVPPDARQKMT